MNRWLPIIKTFAAILIIGILISAILGFIFPARLDTKSVEFAEALLSSGSVYSELPEQAELSIDGVKAIFHIGNSSYNELVNLLHNGRTSEMLEKTGGPISFTQSSRCGELVIWSHGIPSRFPITRGNDNKNLYWIRIPHLNRGGYAILILTADPRFIELLNASSVK